MKTKTRIVHIISSLDSGGIENVLLRTLPILSDDFDYVIITLLRPGELADKFTFRGIRVINIRMNGFLDSGSMRTVVKEVLRLNPKLVITNLFRADLLGRLYLQQRISAPVISLLGTTYNFPKYLPARIFERLTKSLAYHYFANSKAVKDCYVRKFGVPAHKITVMEHGIDLSVFSRANGKRIVDELDLPKQRFIVTCVANLAVNKGHRYLLEAFETVYRAHPEMWLLLAGSGPEENALKRQIQSYASRDHILFLGRRKDVPDILAASHVFVLPTLFEGMSNAILEAMSSRLPVITTDIPENRAIMTDKETGLLVPIQASAPIRNNLERLYTDALLRKRLGHAARRSVERRFAMPVVIKRWRRALKEFSRP